MQTSTSVEAGVKVTSVHVIHFVSTGQGHTSVSVNLEWGHAAVARVRVTTRRALLVCLYAIISRVYCESLCLAQDVIPMGDITKTWKNGLRGTTTVKSVNVE